MSRYDLTDFDRHMIELVADRLVLVDDGTASEFGGSLDDYVDQVLGRGGAAAKARDAGKGDRRPAGPSRDQVKALRDQARAAEREVEQLTAQLARLDAAIATPAAGQSPADLMRQRGAVAKQLEQAEQNWLTASEALEAGLVEA